MGNEVVEEAVYLQVMVSIKREGRTTKSSLSDDGRRFVFKRLVLFNPAKAQPLFIRCFKLASRVSERPLRCAAFPTAVVETRQAVLGFLAATSCPQHHLPGSEPCAALALETQRSSSDQLILAQLAIGALTSPLWLSAGR